MCAAHLLEKASKTMRVFGKSTSPDSMLVCARNLYENENDYSKSFYCCLFHALAEQEY